MSNKQDYRNTRNSSMRDKFTDIRGRIETRPNRHNGSFRDPSASVDVWVDDGLDHINIWEDGKTDLGKVLAHSQPLAFVHSVFGRFQTMEGFWHYIQSKERDDRIRTMSGESLKHFAKKLTPTRVKNFRAIIIDSNYQKIKQYKEIIDEMVNNTLPFDSYYVTGPGLRVRHSYSVWLSPGFEEISKALKEQREPDLSNFMDDRNSGIYDYVIPAYMRKSKQAEVQESQKPESQEAEKPRVPSLLTRLQDTEVPEVQTAQPETPQPETSSDQVDPMDTTTGSEDNAIMTGTQPVVTDPVTGAVVSDGFGNTQPM